MESSQSSTQSSYEETSSSSSSNNYTSDKSGDDYTETLTESNNSNNNSSEKSSDNNSETSTDSSTSDNQTSEKSSDDSIETLTEISDSKKKFISYVITNKEYYSLIGLIKYKRGQMEVIYEGVNFTLSYDKSLNRIIAQSSENTDEEVTSTLNKLLNREYIQLDVSDEIKKEENISQYIPSYYKVLQDSHNKSYTSKAVKWVLTILQIFRIFSSFSKFLFIFYNFAQCIIFFCMFMMIWIEFSTIGIYENLEEFTVGYYILSLIAILYSIYFINLLLLPFRNAFTFSSFSKLSTIYRIINSFMILINFSKSILTGKIFYKISTRFKLICHYINEVIHVILGGITLISLFLFLTDSSLRTFLPNYLMISGIYIPFALIILQYVLYFFHGIVSIFIDENTLIEYHDFDDEFLNCIYLNHTNQFIQSFFKNPKEMLKKSSKWTIFSNLFYLIVTILFIIILIVFIAKGFITALGFILLIIITILSMFIHFPSVIFTRIKRNKKINEETLKMKMYSSSTREELRISFRKYLMWGTKYRIFRWVRFTAFFLAIGIFFVLFYIFVSLREPEVKLSTIYSQNNNLTNSNNDINTIIGNSLNININPNYTTNFEYKNLVQPSICYNKIKGLDVMQAVYFAQLTYQDDEEIEEYLLSERSVFLGDLVHVQEEYVNGTFIISCNTTNSEVCTYVHYNDRRFNRNCEEVILEGTCENQLNIYKAQIVEDYQCLNVQQNKDLYYIECKSTTNETLIYNYTTEIQNYVMDNDFPNRSFYGRYMRRFRVPSLNLTIFGFRGTTANVDIITDVELWLPSVFIRFFDYLFPFVLFSSEENIGKIGDLMLFPKTLFTTSIIDRYINDFSNYIDKNINEIKDLGDDVLCVGHSLGGGLAKLVAIKFGFAVLAMSGGGVAALQNKYKMKNQNVQLISIVDIVPQRDLIPQIDFQSGSVYRIQCDEGYFVCHSLRRNLCQMVASCGEKDNLRLINYCNNYLMENENYNLSHLIKPYQIFSDL